MWLVKQKYLQEIIDLCQKKLENCTFIPDGHILNLLFYKKRMSYTSKNAWYTRRIQDYVKHLCWSTFTRIVKYS